MRDHAHTLSDFLVPTLSIECEPCGRRGRYNVARLMEQYADVKLPELRHVLANCPKARVFSYDQCKVLTAKTVYGREESPLRSALGNWRGKPMTTRTTYLATAAIMALAALAAPGAQAAYVITFQQVGSDVVETGSGALDLADLGVGTFGIARDAEVDPARGRVFSGVFTDTNTSFADLPETLITFGPGSPTTASATTGGPVGFQSGAADITTLIFPAGYISDAPLSDSSTYLGATISSLGLTPGEYVVDWGSGAHADSLTIAVVSPSPVPEPSTWALMLVGFAGLGYAGYRQAKRASSAFS